MSRYIYEDALKEVIQRMWENRKITNTKYNTFLEILDYVPTADVVEVIRCVDCKWYKTFCPFLKGIERIQFCSLGERREDAEAVNTKN